VRLQPQTAAAGEIGAMPDADERAALERLRREKAELCLDRQFFEKAGVFFVSEHNP
jgi:transposase